MAPVVYETGTPSFEQRIGTRSRADWLAVTWVEPPSGGHLDHGAAREWPGQIQDVSVSGASIRGPAGLPVGPHGAFVVRYQGQDSEVVVHRSEPTEDRGVHLYGVEFVAISPLLKAQIYEAVAPKGESPERWDMG